MPNTSSMTLNLKKKIKLNSLKFYQYNSKNMQNNVFLHIYALIQRIFNNICVQNHKYLNTVSTDI